MLGAALAFGACSDGGGGGGGDAVEIAQLKGTVPDSRRQIDRDLEIRAASGERDTTTIGVDGRFEVTALEGDGPFLLRASFGDGGAWYALVHLEGAGSTTANVHGYSDLALRNAVAVTGGASLDTMFDASGSIPDEMLPDARRFDAINQALSNILSPMLVANDLDGTTLSDVPFAADGQGVDKFLEEHPVLVEGDSFTILATDPASDTRTTVSNAVPLSRDLLAVDGVPPRTPEMLRSLPAANDEIVLVWEAASDDIAANLYEVRRDGAVIATTPYPVHTDSPLAGGVDYAYTVVAIDAAGNRSEPTPASVARPLAAPDTISPPAPGDVRIEVVASRARVAWAQSVIADVAAFEILRSIAEGAFDVLARSTSTMLFDVDLPSGTEYCYQVVAIDAAGNRSAPSAVACARTEGAGPESPTTPSVASVAALTACGSLSIANGESRTDPSNPLDAVPGALYRGAVTGGAPVFYDVPLVAGTHRLILDVQDVRSLSGTDIGVDRLDAAGDAIDVLIDNAGTDKLRFLATLELDAPETVRLRVRDSTSPSDSSPDTYVFGVFADGDAVPSPFFVECPTVTPIALGGTVSFEIDYGVENEVFLAFDVTSFAPHELEVSYTGLGRSGVSMLLALLDGYGEVTTGEPPTGLPSFLRSLVEASMEEAHVFFPRDVGRNWLRFRNTLFADRTAVQVSLRLMP